MKINFIKPETELPKSNDIDKIISNHFFTIYGKRREAPNEFTRFADARDNLKSEIYKALKIPQIFEWLAKLLKKDKGNLER